MYQMGSYICIDFLFEEFFLLTENHILGCYLKQFYSCWADGQTERFACFELQPFHTAATSHLES